MNMKVKFINVFDRQNQPCCIECVSVKLSRVSPLQSPMGSGLALAISQASHFLQPPPHQSIIIERMHSGRLNRLKFLKKDVYFFYFLGFTFSVYNLR